jgi:hypothetical protein
MTPLPETLTTFRPVRQPGRSSVRSGATLAAPPGDATVTCVVPKSRLNDRPGRWREGVPRGGLRSVRGIARLRRSPLRL